jgi:hypothetical protein
MSRHAGWSWSVGSRARYVPVEGVQSGDVLLMCDPLIEVGSMGLLLTADLLVILGPAE